MWSTLVWAATTTGFGIGTGPWTGTGFGKSSCCVCLQCCVQSMDQARLYPSQLARIESDLYSTTATSRRSECPFSLNLRLIPDFREAPACIRFCAKLTGTQGRRVKGSIASVVTAWRLMPYSDDNRARRAWWGYPDMQRLHLARSPKLQGVPVVATGRGKHGAACRALLQPARSAAQSSKRLTVQTRQSFEDAGR
ncbi:hypothetical protein PF005_g30866 [Phytophthora fragariae]|uniref:Secreted protein n=1 Tax=Phytophthora fragariae TaxID=53985 RepID=A0A6A3GUG4_9STRA|nr:hypothetical protein PF003_g2904 [Phytophthora fragariae]KAE8918645.1 hypothetical protein PF009_g31042 [Phytophthora fragariae]KAE8960498.1 hypothetical protein PF011_g30071 [Phytophthora fragariae]KAE9059669.1 hypothetical protein PF010_g30527 [Phytophthora fragariae]KAE9060617.1 hypothetical protein PF007_g30540 [Phytophthora fragariae]